MSKNINLSQFFDDLICYLSGQDNLAGYEVEQAEAAKCAVAILVEALTWVRDNPDDNAYWIAKVDSALKKAGAGFA